jgi:Outer membrane protein beta-barrel domain
MYRSRNISKILLIVFSFSIFVNKAYSQFTYGVKAGVSWSTTLSYGDALPYACGLLAGITTDIDLGKHFFISPQLYYAQKGYSFYDGTVYRINYLNLPVLFGYKITSHLQVLLGLNLGILLNSKYDEGDSTIVTTHVYQRIDPGMDAGLRYQLGRWGVDFNFVRSLIGIEKTKQTYYNTNALGEVFPQTGTLHEADKSKNQTFEVSIYYLFGGGK